DPDRAQIKNRFQIRDIQIEHIAWALQSEMKQGYPCGMSFQAARPFTDQSFDRSHLPICSIASSTSGTRPAPKMKLCYPWERECRPSSTPASFARWANSTISPTNSS